MQTKLIYNIASINFYATYLNPNSINCEITNDQEQRKGIKNRLRSA